MEMANSVGTALRDRVIGGTGVTVLASAAAATAGLAAIPVYEIYKAGAKPAWLDGLDLLTAAGLRVALIPHYDNAEGGTHDTRYCYLGERRLSEMEASLPDGTSVLGVDEHTVLILDLTAQTAGVRGRGGVTIRRHGESAVIPAPAVIPLDQLRAAVSGEAGMRGPVGEGGVLGLRLGYHDAGASQPAEQHKRGHAPHAENRAPGLLRDAAPGRPRDKPADGRHAEGNYDDLDEQPAARRLEQLHDHVGNAANLKHRL